MRHASQRGAILALTARAQNNELVGRQIGGVFFFHRRGKSPDIRLPARIVNSGACPDRPQICRPLSAAAFAMLDRRAMLEANVVTTTRPVLSATTCSGRWRHRLQSPNDLLTIHCAVAYNRIDPLITKGFQSLMLGDFADNRIGVDFPITRVQNARAAASHSQALGSAIEWSARYNQCGTGQFNCSGSTICSGTTSEALPLPACRTNSAVNAVA